MSSCSLFFMSTVINSQSFLLQHLNFHYFIYKSKIKISLLKFSSYLKEYSGFLYNMLLCPKINLYLIYSYLILYSGTLYSKEYILTQDTSKIPNLQWGCVSETFPTLTPSDFVSFFLPVPPTCYRL